MYLLHQMRAGAIVLALLLAGCSSEGVREDRTITSSADSQSVAFQHGEKGVYVRSAGELIKVFQPTADVIATSTPQFSPVDDRAIFCTAALPASPDGAMQDAPARADWDANPEGRRFHERNISYSCWLREPGGEPIKLFTAPCGHSGYVAANLAVRWHSDGQRIWHIEQIEDGRHCLMLFDIASGQSEYAGSPIADELVFDVSPDGGALACVVGGKPANAFFDGIWVQHLPHGEWWHVDGSQHLRRTSGVLLLEALRASLPVWRPADSKGEVTGFAFGSAVGNEGDKVSECISLVEIGTKNTQVVLQSASAPRDLRWHPSGDFLACVIGKGELHTVTLAGKVAKLPTDYPVRRFAGWNSIGSQFAYTTTHATSKEECWATILRPAPTARDRLVVGGENGDPEKIVFDGMRITFPTWASEPSQVTFWGTFTPSHQLIFPWGMPWGDPAATLNVETGQVDWMAVDAQELYQIGHWELMHKNYTQASKWYEQARAGDEEPPADVLQAATNMLLEAICLEKLGRMEVARSRRADFDNLFNQQSAENEALASLLALSRALFIAQAYLSVDAGDDAVARLREELKAADDETERMHVAVALSQLLLIQGQHAAYARLSTSDIAATFAKAINQETEVAGEQYSFRFVNTYLTGMALLPMFRSEFVQALAPEQRTELIENWTRIRSQSSQPIVHLGCDLFLAAAHTANGDAKAAEAFRQRSGENPVARQFLGEAGIDGLQWVWQE